VFVAAQPLQNSRGRLEAVGWDQRLGQVVEVRRSGFNVEGCRHRLKRGTLWHGSEVRRGPTKVGDLNDLAEFDQSESSFARCRSSRISTEIMVYM
jgi:hypothetical protein